MKRKLHPLSFRTTLHLRERLVAAAAANGRSLAEEVEHRLTRTFDEDVAAELETSPRPRVRKTVSRDSAMD